MAPRLLMDRLMSKVGLAREKFYPDAQLLRCAIPGIMARATIERRKTGW